MTTHGFHIFLSLLLALFPFPLHSRKHYTGYKVFLAVPNSSLELGFLKRLAEEVESGVSKIDFWRPPSEVSFPVEFLVPPREIEETEEYLRSNGVRWNITVQDLEKEIEKERTPVSSNSTGRSRMFYDQAESYDFYSYHRLSSMDSYLKNLQNRFPERISLKVIGRTHEKRPLTVAKLGKKNTKKTAKPAIWVDGGIHAREWISPATVMYFIKTLTENPDEDPEIESLMEELDWYILPVVNPDGYEYSHSDDRMWRKNRAPPVVCRRWMGCCKGVDLNRNFDWHFLESGASRKPCDETYAGKAPFSEPESKAIKDFVLPRKERIKAFITLHSFSQIWMYPFGHKRREYPKNLNDLRSVGKKAVEALRKVRGTRYTMGTGADTLYEASGGSDDWAKGKMGIDFVYLLELPPCDRCRAGFILPRSQILPTAKETWAALSVVGEEMVARYTTMGTSTTSSSSSSSTTSMTPTTTVTSTTPKQSTDTSERTTPENNIKRCKDKSRWCGWWFNKDCSKLEIQERCEKHCELC